MGAIVEHKFQEINPVDILETRVDFIKPIYALRQALTLCVEPKKASQKFGAERKSLV